MMNAYEVRSRGFLFFFGVLENFFDFSLSFVEFVEFFEDWFGFVILNFLFVDFSTDFHEIHFLVRIRLKLGCRLFFFS